jgi:hypothetical protein
MTATITDLTTHRLRIPALTSNLSMSRLARHVLDLLVHSRTRDTDTKNWMTQKTFKDEELGADHVELLLILPRRGCILLSCQGVN